VGKWDLYEFKSRVVGRDPVILIVEWAASAAALLLDPTRASFVFSLPPKLARYPRQGQGEGALS
jgi:hypothetical protein